MDTIAHTKSRELLKSSWGRRLGWAMASLLGIWLLAWLAVPALVKAQAEKLGSAALGRMLTIGAVDFQPWSLELTLRDVRVAGGGAGQEPALLEIGRIYVDAELESLLHLAPVVDAIEIDAPHVRATHLGNGRYDFDDILAKLSQPSEAPGSSPARLAVYNVVINGGAVDFTDTTAQGAVHHTVRKLHLAVPFVSTLPTQRNVKVEPRLALEVNGSAWDSAAQATPFAETRKGELSLQLHQLDFKPYLAYWPAALPVRLQGAVLDADLRARFEQAQAATVQLSGTLALRDVSVADARGQPLLDLAALRVSATRVEPLAGQVELASVELDAPKARLERLANGKFSFEPNAKPSASATKKEAAQAVNSRASAENGYKMAAVPWRVTLDRFKLQGGELQWTDQTTTPRAQVHLDQVALEASKLQWPPGEQDALAQASLRVAGKKPAEVRIEAQGTPQAGQATLVVQQLSLALGAPYVAQFLVPEVAGMVDAGAAVRWKDGELQATLERLRARDLALVLPPGSEGPALPQVKALEVDNAQINLAQHAVRVGKVRVQGPTADVERDAQGQWMFQRWLRSANDAPGSAPTEVPAKPWDIRVEEALVDGGAVRVRDRSVRPSVRLDVSALQLQVQRFNASGKEPAAIRLGAKLRSGEVAAGQLQFNGTAAWAPVVAQGKLLLQDIPAHALVPYVADKLNVEVVRADANFDGTVQYRDTPQGPSVQVDADMALEDLRMNTLSGDEGRDELLSWKALNLPGVALRMAPGAPLQLKVREVGLNDFYARVIVNPQGRLNLQDIVKSDTAAAPATAASVPAASTAPTAAADPVIDVGPVTLAHGRVQFSDRFIQPNYSANLSELNGRLSQFSSRVVDGAVQLADLEVRGRAEGTATLFIGGKVNPLAKPLALDIQGKVRDLELSPLSPYAIKYAGYGIERGKMSVDVGYKVQPDGKLDASNNIVLNQLQFGDKVEGAPNSLPVKLAVALLADRNGVIDINLPISGSLNDPEFKIGAVVWKVITNLIVKAVTAPFNLLASAFGGGGGDDEMNAVSFPNGKSSLGKEAAATLDKLAKALVERPSIRLTVVGEANFALEREALRRERLNTLLLGEKRRRAVIDGQDASAVLVVEPGEYSGLLKQVYRRSDVKKPRNLVGMVKDLGDAEMEKLLLDSVTVSEESVRELALARGVAVKEYLASRQVPVERVFLGAIKTTGFDVTWSPRAELTLQMQ